MGLEAELGAIGVETHRHVELEIGADGGATGRRGRSLARHRAGRAFFSDLDNVRQHRPVLLRQTVNFLRHGPHGTISGDSVGELLAPFDPLRVTGEALFFQIVAQFALQRRERRIDRANLHFLRGTPPSLWASAGPFATWVKAWAATAEREKALENQWLILIIGGGNATRVQPSMPRFQQLTMCLSAFPRLPKRIPRRARSGARSTDRTPAPRRERSRRRCG